ncbi:hypothetical protein MRX96_030450 [Rhipicephalus microplus]
MTDTPSKDAPDEITLCASLHATATSRPSSPKQSPAAPMITRARKLKAAANRLQKHSSTSTPTSRPHVRRIGKLLPPRRRRAPTIKAATTKSAKLTAAAEEAAAAISLVPQPSQLHLVPTLQEGSKAELQDYQESVASTPADSEEQASTDSSSPTSSSSWEHNTPPSSSPSLSPSPKGLALFRTGICADGPGRQRATQQASFAAPPQATRAHSAPPATTFCPCLLAGQACRAGRQEDLFGEGCARSAVSPLFPGEGTRMTSTGRATEATLESLAQAGASQTATGNPTLLEPSPPSSGHATRPTRPPERAASPVSDGVVCLPPTSSPQQQHSPPLSRSKESTGASSATAAAPPNSAASTAPHPPSAFGPMRPLTVDASTEADYEEARRKHQQKNGFPCQASTATNAPSSRQPASAAPPSKGKGPRQKPGELPQDAAADAQLPQEQRAVGHPEAEVLNAVTAEDVCGNFLLPSPSWNKLTFATEQDAVHFGLCELEGEQADHMLLPKLVKFKPAVNQPELLCCCVYLRGHLYSQRTVSSLEEAQTVLDSTNSLVLCGECGMKPGNEKCYVSYAGSYYSM